MAKFDESKLLFKRSVHEDSSAFPKWESGTVGYIEGVERDERDNPYFDINNKRYTGRLWVNFWAPYGAGKSSLYVDGTWSDLTESARKILNEVVEKHADAEFRAPDAEELQQIADGAAESEARSVFGELERRLGRRWCYDKTNPERARARDIMTATLTELLNDWA